MELSVQPAVLKLIIRVTLLIIAIVVAYGSMYCIWYIVRGRHKKEQKQAQTTTKAKEQKESKSKKKDKDPDFCPLNEIMGYEFITIQHISDSQEKKTVHTDDSAQTADYGSSKSPYLDSKPKALDVTSSQAEEEIDTPVIPNPSYNPVQEKKPASNPVDSSKPSAQDKPRNEESEATAINVSEDIAQYGMFEEGNPWPENRKTEDDGYLNWLYSDYIENDGVREIQPTEKSEEDLNEESLEMLDDPNFDDLICENKLSSNELLGDLNLNKAAKEL